MDHTNMQGMPGDSGKKLGMDQSAMGHGSMACDQSMTGMDMGSMNMRDFSKAQQVKRGPGVQTISPMPMDRTGEPGQGLEDGGHKVLTHRDLMALDRNPDVRAPSRSIDIHLTGNMRRFSGSFEGTQLSTGHEHLPFIKDQRV